MTEPLPPAVSGERFEFDSPAGRLSAYVAGSGPPLLLVHSVNAAASAAEVRPLHEHYNASRRVFALDLPGFGFSERGDRRYTLGGAWSDPTYLYTGPDALDPLERSPILGVRCAVYEAKPPESVFGPLTRELRILNAEFEDRVGAGAGER